MSDIAVLQDACVAAEQVKADLLVERRENRTTMSKVAFREYNESTRDQQLKVQKLLDSADRKFRKALDEIRVDAVHQVVNVGTLNEGNQPQGVNTDA